jgi:RNA polymerase sigma factor (sigma-70 family)
MSGMSGTVAVYGGDDTELVTAVRRGDDRAFEVLYQRYHARIAAYVRGMVKDHARAEDVTQEVFFAALRRMRDTERPIAFKPWIYEIARNACIDAYRRTSRADELSYDAEGGLGAGDHLRLVSPDQGPDAAVESKQRLDDLCGAFGGLSEAHHQILVLRELEGLSYREIGERLGMSRPAVESTLFRARRRLTEEYDELVSGRRCERVQAIITSAAEGMLGARDRRKLARHTATCQACRRHARHMGLGDVEAPTTARGKLAAFLPIPAFLRRGGDGAGAAGGHGSNLAAQVSSSLGAMADPVAVTWTKAVAAAAALAFAGAGAHVAAQNGHPLPGLGNLPLVGAKEPAKPEKRNGNGKSGVADPQSVRSVKAGAGESAKGGSSGRSNGPTEPAAARDAGGREDTSTSSALPAASAPATPDAPDAGVSLPDVTAPDTPETEQPPPPSDPSSGIQLNTDAVSIPQGSGTSTPATPEAPSVPDVGSVVSSVTGTG